MYYVDIYAAQRHTDRNLEQSGRSERKRFRIFLKFDFEKLVLTLGIYLKFLRNITVFILTSTLWVLS